jgi:hypothetical protein
MPAQFSKLGISFQYPENWTLDYSDAVLGRKSVTVYSPAGAFWSVAIQSGSAVPDKMAGAIVDAMREEYEGLEVVKIEKIVAGHELIGYDLNFYCLDLTNTAQVRSLQIAHTTYTIFCQAEDREFERIGRVFEAMTTSLINGLLPQKSI